jgi:CyaY protein
MDDEKDFRKRADDSLHMLYRALNDAADDYGFEVDLQAGALTVEFEHPHGKFVISPNAPARQIWVSAHSKSYKLDWDTVENSFVYGSDRQPLKQLIEEAISKQLGQEVSL